MYEPHYSNVLIGTSYSSKSKSKWLLQVKPETNWLKPVHTLTECVLSYHMSTIAQSALAASQVIFVTLLACAMGSRILSIVTAIHSCQSRCWTHF